AALGVGTPRRDQAARSRGDLLLWADGVVAPAPPLRCVQWVDGRQHWRGRLMAQPTSRVLSSSQLALLAEHGEERTAEVGTILFKIGDETYAFIALLEGE